MRRCASKRAWLWLGLALTILVGADWAVAQDNVTITAEDEPVLVQTEPMAEPPAAAAQTGPEPEIEEVTELPPLEVQGEVIPSLPLQDAPIRLVLKQLAQLSQKNIIASQAVTGTVTADLYNVTFREALDAILRVNGFDYIEQGNFIYVYTAEEMEDIREAQRVMQVRVFHLNYAQAEDVQALIAPAMSSDGSIAVTPAAMTGIATSDTSSGGVDYALGDMLVIRDYEENLDQIAEIIEGVDERPRQVLIEATILRATLSEDNALGIDFNTLAGVQFETLDTSSSGLTNATTGTFDVPANPNDATFRTDFNSAIAPGGFSFGYIGSHFAMFLRALESVTDTVVLANPKLLVVNKQRGEVLVGRRDGYLTTTITETTATQTVEFLETGTRLVVRPFIGDDDYVRLEIHPEDSSGSVADGLPSEQTTEVTTNLLVRDGHTIIIGGLFREITTSTRAQVPGLGNIPYLGMALGRTVEDTTREEVIVLITPRIIQQPVDEIVSEQLRDDIERIRLGRRQQLMWFGRSRLANSHLQWAKQHISNGNIESAMWDLDMALSMSPRLTEAQDLKEELTQQAVWECEPRVSTSRWIIERMMAQELDLDYRQLTTPERPLDSSELPESWREERGIAPAPRVPLDIPEEPMELSGFGQLNPEAESADAAEDAPTPLLETTAVPQATPDVADVQAESEQPVDAVAEQGEPVKDVAAELQPISGD